jgi:prepilin-type N-terminal cleavage/methylation domain
MKNKEKGFTIIELIATTLILAAVILIAIPAVSNYVENSRRKGYISTARSYIKSVRNHASAYKYRFEDKDAIYYLPIKCITMEKKAPSPYGEWVEAYVVVITDGTSPTYYWTSFDKSWHGMEITQEKDINTSSVIPQKKEINKTEPVEGRTKLIIMEEDTCKFS